MARVGAVSNENSELLCACGSNGWTSRLCRCRCDQLLHWAWNVAPWLRLGLCATFTGTGRDGRVARSDQLVRGESLLDRLPSELDLYQIALRVHTHDVPHLGVALHRHSLARPKRSPGRARVSASSGRVSGDRLRSNG